MCACVPRARSACRDQREHHVPWNCELCGFWDLKSSRCHYSYPQDSSPAPALSQHCEKTLCIARDDSFKFYCFFFQTGYVAQATPAGCSLGHFYLASTRTVCVCHHTQLRKKKKAEGSGVQGHPRLRGEGELAWAARTERTKMNRARANAQGLHGATS